MRNSFLWFLSLAVLSGITIPSAHAAVYAAPSVVVTPPPANTVVVARPKTVMVNPASDPTCTYNFGTVSLTYTGDVVGGFKGPLKNKIRYFGLADLKAGIDTESLYGWQGSSAFIEVHNLHGDKPNRLLRSVQGFDNIDYRGVNTLKLYQLWLQAKVNEAAYFLVGQYDLGSEFYVTESASSFVLPTLRVGTELAQSGANGPSIYPTPSLGIRFKVKPNDDVYLQAAIVDAVAGDPNNPRGNHFHLRERDGALMIVEAGAGDLKLNWFPPAKLALGAWYYTPKSADKMDANVKHHNTGGYVLIDGPIEYTHNKQLRWFARFGMAEKNVNNFHSALGTGLTFYSLNPNRPEDIVGLAYAPAWTTKKARLADGSLVKIEHQYELTYLAKVNPNLHIQPFVQLIRFKGGDKTINKSSVHAGLRFKVIF